MAMQSLRERLSPPDAWAVFNSQPFVDIDHGGALVQAIVDTVREPLLMLDKDLRRPSNFHQRGSEIVIADLEGRVTIIDGQNRIITHLGDNKDPELRGKNPIPPEKWVDGQFISPHCVRWDSDGNLYVAEWLSTGRIIKLKRV